MLSRRYSLLGNRVIEMYSCSVIDWTTIGGKGGKRVVVNLRLHDF